MLHIWRESGATLFRIYSRYVVTAHIDHTAALRISCAAHNIARLSG
jgi:hypothetical protein